MYYCELVVSIIRWCLDTRQPRLKYYTPVSLKFILEFPWRNSSNPSLNSASLFRKSSDFNYNCGFEVKEIFELGHTIKPRCFDA